MEKASAIKLELKDLDTNKRTALIMHSVYNSIDRVGDISHKGMFTKSWQENKPQIYINHDGNLVPGTTTRTFEDERGGYTELKFGTWTLGNDALEMADNGVFTGASFGYETKKKDFSTINGRKIRNLREVKHAETSLLTVEAAHPEAGLISLVKSMEDINELMGLQDELKAYFTKIETYCRKATASDETIIALQNANNEYKLLIQSIDTAITQLIPEPIVSDDGVKSELDNFLTSLKLERWQKQNLTNKS